MRRRAHAVPLRLLPLGDQTSSIYILLGQNDGLRTSLYNLVDVLLRRLKHPMIQSLYMMAKGGLQRSNGRQLGLL